MIVAERRSWIQVVFTIRGTALPRIWRRLLVTTAVVGGMTWLHENTAFPTRT